MSRTVGYDVDWGCDVHTAAVSWRWDVLAITKQKAIQVDHTLAAKKTHWMLLLVGVDVCFPCFFVQAQSTQSLKRATITTLGRKLPPRCTTSLWENCGSIRWASKKLEQGKWELQEIKELTGSPRKHRTRCSATLCKAPCYFLENKTVYISVSLPVWRDRRSEPHHRRPLPSEVRTLQLLLQRCGQEG